MPNTHDAFTEDLVGKFDHWFEDGSWLRHAAMRSDLHPYTHLFSPIQVNSITIKNRIVMGPMGNVNMVEEMGRPSNKMIQYFTERARGGVGLITSGLVPVSQGIDPTVTEPGGRTILPRLSHSRSAYAGWRILAENIHAHGSHFFIQLTSGLGRVGNPEVLMTQYKLPVSASWNPNFYISEIPCRPLTDGQCRHIIKATGQAAADAKALLIDGVYLHGHEGYLLEQMTNTAFNRRKWGHYSDWQAFGLETVQEIRKRVGLRYPIMYRIDLSLALNATYGEKMSKASSLKKFINERTSEMTLQYMANLVKAGVDLFDVDLGSYDNWWLPHPPNSMPPGCYLEVARTVKQYFAAHQVKSNAGLPVPIVAVGKLGYPDLAEYALQEGSCDMVMLARPLLADPQWPVKAYSGRVNEIVPCIGDQEGCLNEFLEGGHPQCSVNPRSGFEDVIERDLQPAPRSRKVAVIGAGPAGILCAATAAQRGHQVTLFEKRPQVGGMLVPGSTPTSKNDVANYLKYLEGLLHSCRKEYGLELQLGQEATAESLFSAGFDSIVVCTGAIPARPPIPGLDAPHVIQAVDLLRDPSLADLASQVLVVGGGAVGCECAHFLAAEKNKKVTIIEMLPYFMKGLCTANRGHLIHLLEKENVPLLNCTRLKEISNGQAVVTRNISSSVPDPYITWKPILPENIPNPLGKAIRQDWQDQTLETDLVILATGLVPDRALYAALVQASLPAEITHIGDCFQIGRVFEAVKAGFATGRNI
jgi:2-enoate reductase